MNGLLHLDEIEVKINEIKKEINNVVGYSRNAFSNKNSLKFRVSELEKISNSMDKLLNSTGEIKGACLSLNNEFEGNIYK